MHKYYIILFIFIFLGCQNDQDLIGHWHIQTVIKDSPYIGMDIINDSVALLGVNSIYRTSYGKFNMEDKTINFPSNCCSLCFDYERNGDELLLKGRFEDWTAVSCDSCCTNLADFKEGLKIKVDLPELEQNSSHHELREINSKRYMESIIVGHLKHPWSNGYGATGIFLEMDGIVTDADDIQIWIDRKRVKYPDAEKRNMIVRIVADRLVRTSELKSIVKVLEEKNISNIVITCLKEDYRSQDNMFLYIPTGTIDFDVDRKLSELIN